VWNERGGPLRELTPYPGQAEQALRLVHVRRRRALAFVASLAGLVVLASLVLTARGGGLAMLEPVEPAVARTATPVPGGEHADPGGRRGHGDAAADAAAPGRALPHTQYSAAATAPRVAAAAGPTPAPPAPAGPAPVRDAIRRTQAQEPFACVGTGEWCGTATATDAGNGTAELAAQVCRPAVRDPARLRFAAKQEVEFLLYSRETGEEVWRWSTAPAPPRPHAVVVQSGSCVTWTTQWTGLGDDGRPLPAGDYVLHAVLLSQERVALSPGSWQAV
jgi:hypothetical protein